MGKYIISIDQSTQGTKAMLFEENGVMLKRCDKEHRQIINELGWVSHDMEEIYQNVVEVIKNVVSEAKINKDEVVGLAISNQRETSVIWDRESKKPLENAIVWQCARAKDICEREELIKNAELINQRTGLKLSPYFPAAKFKWLIENTDNLNDYCLGTVDAYLIHRLTGEFKTDVSNASRYELMNLESLKWDQDVCDLFGINSKHLPTICMSDALFGTSDVEGYFAKPIPVHAVMGDSHAALFGQGCHHAGDIKATYGTGSSIMMNIGSLPAKSYHGLVTSLAYGYKDKTYYAFEGNLNYTGATISWLKNDLELIKNASETEDLANQALKDDTTYIVPAFSGLGAPYWDSNAKAAIVGMDRTTTRKEIVRAALESIAYQITDIVEAMSQDSNVKVKNLCVDGGPTRNGYLMQFQSDISNANILVPNVEELSGIGVAYMCGIALGIYNETVFNNIQRKVYEPEMDNNIREMKYNGWKDAVNSIRR